MATNELKRIVDNRPKLRRVAVGAIVVLASFTAGTISWLNPLSGSAAAFDASPSTDFTDTLATLDQNVRSLVSLLSPLAPAAPQTGQGDHLWDERLHSGRAGHRSPAGQLRAAVERLAALNAVLRAGGDPQLVDDAAGSPLIHVLLERARAMSGGPPAAAADSPSLTAAMASLLTDNGTGSGTGGGMSPPRYSFLKPSHTPCKCPSQSRAPSHSRCPSPPAAKRAPGALPAATLAEEAALLPSGGITSYDRSPQPPGDAYFVTYGDESFARSRARLANEAASYPGVFQHIFPLNRSSFDPRWASANKALLGEKRGGGYWVWKPHLLLRVLEEQMADGDVLLYADAGCTFVADPTPYLRLASEHGLVLFRNRHAMWTWTKGYTFAALGMSMEEWGEDTQLAGGIIALQKRPWVQAFLREWMRVMTEDPRTVNDVDTAKVAPNHASFKQHRHDQAVLSLLAYKHGVYMHPYHSYPKEKALIIAATRGRG